MRFSPPATTLILCAVVSLYIYNHTHNRTVIMPSSRPASPVRSFSFPRNAIVPPASFIEDRPFNWSKDCHLEYDQRLERNHTVQQSLSIIESNYSVDCSNFTYIICGPVAFGSSKYGGHLVLGSMLTRLTQLGCKAFAISHDATTLPLGVDPDKVIVVYPEGARGNQVAGVRRYCHWLLFWVDAGKRFNSNQLLLTFGGWEGMVAGKGRPNSVVWSAPKTPNMLHVTCASFQTQLMKDESLDEARSGAFYLIYKGAKYWSPQEIDAELEKIRKYSGSHPPVRFPDNGDSEQFWALAKTKKYFFSFDPASYNSVQAVLCGCISVVIKHPTAEKMENIYGISKGIAWGFEEIEKSIAERPDFFKQIRCRDAYAQETVKYFAWKTQNWDAFYPVEN